MDIQAPLPPPPPPPTMPNMTMANHQHQQAPLNLNNTRNMSDRSQLLLEIERGTTLKRVANSQKGLNTRSMNQLKQRRIQNLKTVEINKLNCSSNGFTAETHTNGHHKIETVSVRSTTKTTTTTTETDCFQSSPILPRRAQLFKQQQNLEKSKITSPTIHRINNGTVNYKPKPITSFSRDLQLTPNRYPEKVQVTKTSSEPEPVFFSDIKFIINSNGEVVRS